MILKGAFKVPAPSEKHPELRVDPLAIILEEFEKHYGSNILIYAWSSHEQEAINHMIADTELLCVTFHGGKHRDLAGSVAVLFTESLLMWTSLCI